MGRLCWILPVLFFIVSQHVVVQQVLFGTLFFSYASPSPPGVHRSSCSNFQSITNFRIPDNVVCGTKLESEVLHWAGGTWKVMLYPCGKDSPITTGNCSDDDGYASIYLELKSGDSPKDVIFRFSLLSTDGEDIDEYTPEIIKYDGVEARKDTAQRGITFNVAVHQGLIHSWNSYWNNLIPNHYRYPTLTLYIKEYFTEPALECLNSEGTVSVRISLQDKNTTTAPLSLASNPLPPRGLRNLGNTCYMNAILQVHFHADMWKDVIVSSAQPKAPSTTSALRKIFNTLSLSVESPGGGLEDVGGVETSSLVMTLGIDPTIQQDAQEFGCTLLQEIESEARGQGWSEILKGRKAAFEGSLENYIECVNHLAEKRWQETFFDLSIDVKGYSSLNESLDALLKPELLTGENKWRTQKHGYQEARKGIRLVSLPPILQFHLKRFEYHPKTQTMVKVNSQFMFPMEIDMGPWCNDPVGGYKGGDKEDGFSSSQGKSLHYTLRSIVMHQGGLERGHYYTYVRRKRKDDKFRWFKLDDNRVSSVEESEVLEDAFGCGRRKWGGLTSVRGVVMERGKLFHF